MNRAKNSFFDQKCLFVADFLKIVLPKFCSGIGGTTPPPFTEKITK